MFRSPVLFFLLLLGGNVWSQSGKDTVFLLNGDIVVASVIDTSLGVTSLRNPKNPEKNFVIENDRIFSIKDSTGEHMLYVYDTAVGNEFTVEEMRYFMYGERDADKGFKAKGSFYGNMALSAAAGVTGYFLCPIPTFAFTALTDLPKVKIKHSTVSNEEYLKHDPYVMGYERVARKKRKLRSLLGGGIGLGVGLGTFFILKSTGNDPIK
jgi:hypothetical protein